MIKTAMQTALLGHLKIQVVSNLFVLRPSTSPDAKTFLLKQFADFINVVALQFDAPFFGRAAATAGVAKFFGEGLNLFSADVRRELIDHNHHFSAAMRRFTPQHDAPKFQCHAGKDSLTRMIPF